MITSENKQQIKNLILINPIKMITIEKVAKGLKISRGTAEKYLIDMELKGILKREEEFKNNKYVFKWWKIDMGEDLTGKNETSST